MKPIAFRIYPEHRSLFYEVAIFENRKQMLAAARRDHPGEKGITNDTMAFCSCYRKEQHIGGTWRKTKVIGKIYFYRSATGVDTVTHEMFHALSGYLAARKLKVMEFTTEWASPLEERCCQIIGGMVGDFFRHHRKHFSETLL